MSDHGPVDTEEEHPLEHHHRPSVVKLIHRAFSGCKRANSSRAPHKYNAARQEDLKLWRKQFFMLTTPTRGMTV